MFGAARFLLLITSFVSTLSLALEIGQRGSIDGQPYEIKKSLGSGAEGEVWLAQSTWEPSKTLAVKSLANGRLARTEKKWQRIHAINELMAPLQKSEEILVYKNSTFYDEEDGSAEEVFVSRVLAGVNLSSWRTDFEEDPRGISEPRKSEWMRASEALINDSGDALAALIGLGVLHRDIKPANIVYAEGRMVLIDMGGAILASEAEQDEFGTHSYFAPELPVSGASFATDLWARGLVIAFLITGKHLQGEFIRMKAGNRDPTPDKVGEVFGDMRNPDIFWPEFYEGLVIPALEDAKPLYTVLDRDGSKYRRARAIVEAALLLDPAERIRATILADPDSSLAAALRKRLPELTSICSKWPSHP